MKKPKPEPPMNIRFDRAQRRFIRMTAKVQGHYNQSEVVRRIVKKEMGVTT